MIAIWKLAAALVYGYIIVLKPSGYTSLTLLRVAELTKTVDIPGGVINMVNDTSGEITQRPMMHPTCTKVSFTGPVVIDKRAQQSAYAPGKWVTLELGGEDAALLLSDPTPEAMVGGIIETGYLN